MDTLQDITTTLREQYKVLPKSVRDFIAEHPLKGVITRVARDYNLDEEQTKSLTLVTSTLLFGLLDPLEFVAAIKENVGVAQEYAEEIATDLNNYLLEPILPDLIEYHTYLEEEERSQAISEEINKSSTEQTYAEEDREEETAPTISKEDVLDAIENPIPSEVKKVSNEPNITRFTANKTTTPPDEDEILPKLKIMPHTTQELASEQTHELAIQKQVSTSFIAKKLTQPQSASSANVSKPAVQKPNPDVLGVPRYTGGDDPYREPVK